VGAVGSRGPPEVLAVLGGYNVVIPKPNNTTVLRKYLSARRPILATGSPISGEREPWGFAETGVDMEIVAQVCEYARVREKRFENYLFISVLAALLHLLGL
jgi:hypothetical protein